MCALSLTRRGPLDSLFWPSLSSFPFLFCSDDSLPILLFDSLSHDENWQVFRLYNVAVFPARFFGSLFEGSLGPNGRSNEKKRRTRATGSERPVTPLSPTLSRTQNSRDAGREERGTKGQSFRLLDWLAGVALAWLASTSGSRRTRSRTFRGSAADLLASRGCPSSASARVQSGDESQLSVFGE